MLIGTALLLVIVTKSLVSQNLQSSSENTYNHISVTGTPINNGEFIFGGGTYRDVNLKLKLKIPMGWSISLGGSGDRSENIYEIDPTLRILSNNQKAPENRNFNETELIEQITFQRVTFDPLLYTSYEDAVGKFSKIKDEDAISMVSEDFLLAGKYKAHRFDIEYKANVFATDGDGTKSPMRFRTFVFVEYNGKLYTIDSINTDFYNSPQVQEMLNSIEFYE